MTRSRLGDLIATGLIDGLDPRDRMLLERRARIKSTGDEPFPLDPRGWWYAVPGAMYEGLFEALGLHDRFPVTLDEGADVEDLPFRGDAVPTFVTPELDGWRLIFGNLADLVGLGWDEWMGAVERLSALCGEAQMFYEDPAGGADIWVVAQKGLIRRRYAAQSNPEWIGDPLPWEELGVDDADPNAGTARVAHACGRLSVDPGEIGATTRVRGHGWLALSRPGIGHENLNALVQL
ncbi:hypothetical protein AQI88_39565 [Streptomyces cellostaticus]|uniref:Uncharacterized protein n=1 Tax=Streptomyces cellostaticus TaxID=67285 RepID=A0A101NAX2_9ACTN|nr:hypothetical protein [Streptomyces cellostaticus]KUM89760.1 hypothetical protein AQI88_39565 [Streptomyces cellostaticus]GHI10207.1 hypothetical protein Scel_85280 [Streptomyces cellostaticus]